MRRLGKHLQSEGPPEYLSVPGGKKIEVELGSGGIRSEEMQRLQLLQPLKQLVLGAVHHPGPDDREVCVSLDDREDAAQRRRQARAFARPGPPSGFCSPIDAFFCFHAGNDAGCLRISQRALTVFQRRLTVVLNPASAGRVRQHLVPQAATLGGRLAAAAFIVADPAAALAVEGPTLLRLALMASSPIQPFTALKALSPKP